MLTAEVASVFSSTLSPDESVRKAAEKHLEHLVAEPSGSGFHAIVNCLVATDVPAHINLAAAVYIKNHVVTHYRHFSVELKSFLAANILPWLANSTQPIRLQLATVLKVIADVDYVDSPLPIIHHIVATFPTSDIHQVSGYILALRVLLKSYQFRSVERRAVLDEIVPLVFPLLERLFEAAWAHQNTEINALVMKIFFSVIFLSLPQYLQNPTNMSKWCHMALMVVRQFEPKSSKWAAYVLFRLLIRFGNPKTAHQDYKDFAAFFLSSIAPTVTQTYIEMLLAGQGSVRTQKTLIHILNWLADGVKIAALYAIIKPHVQSLVQTVVYPLVCLSKEDEEAISEDPGDYLRSNYDWLAEMDSVPKVATTFLTDLAVSRSSTIPFLADLIFRNLQAPSSPQALFGILRVLNAFHEILQSKKLGYAQHIQRLISEHIIPLLAHPQEYVRAEAVVTLERYYSRRTVSYILQAMQDRSLLVRAQAAISLRPFLEHIEGVTLVRQNLQQVLGIYLNLISEMENDQLVNALEKIVAVLEDDVRPYALALIEKLAQQAMGMIAEEKDELVFAIQSCLGTIATLTSYIDDAGRNSAESILVPFLSTLLDARYLDMVEDVMPVFTNLTFFGEKISDLVWALWPKLVSLAAELGGDYFEALMPVFDNYLSYGTDVFLARRDVLDGLFSVLQKVMTDFQQENQRPTVAALQVLCTLLEHARGKHDVGFLLPTILMYPVQFLSTLDKNAAKPAGHADSPAQRDVVVGKNVRTLCCDVICDSFAYNAVQTSAVLADRLQSLLRLILTSAQSLHREYDIKVHILGLWSLFEISPSATLLLAVLMLIKRNRDLYYEETDPAAAGEADDDAAVTDSADLDIHAVSDECDVLDDKDSAYLKALQREIERAQSDMTGAMGGDDDDGDEFSLDDEVDYHSPIDDIDEVALVVDALQSQWASAMSQMWQSGQIAEAARLVGVSDVSVLWNDCILERNERREEEEKRKQEEALQARQAASGRHGSR